MRHFNVPRLERESYYAVFCDCGKELQRFPDTADQTGQQHFQTWLDRADPLAQWCNRCASMIAKPESAPDSLTGDQSAQAAAALAVSAAAGGVAASVANPHSFSSYLDEMSRTVQTVLDEFDFTRANLDAKREAAKRISHIAATICTAIALQPIPFADVLLLTPIQILMVQSIGRIYGVPLTAKTAYEVATNIGLGVVLQQVFAAIVKMGVPMMGGLLISSYVYSATFYMGKLAQIYFEKGRPLTAEEQQTAQTSYSRAETRLREIDQLKNQSLITEDEYQQKRKQILDEI